jgi:predicted Zn-dependent protease
MRLKHSFRNSKNAAFIADADFKLKIQNALDLLKAKAATNYVVVTNNAEKIVAFEKSGSDVYKSIIQIAKPTFDSSETWLASVLVHESCHIAQHAAKEKWTGKEAEQECNAIQLETLRLIGAPPNEITYMLAQTGEHFDENGDGKFNKKDYELRDY